MMTFSQLATWIEQQQWHSLAQWLPTQHVIRLSDAVAKLSLAQQIRLFTQVSEAAPAFEYLPEAYQVQLAQHLPMPILAQLTAQMHSDQRTDFYLLLAPDLQQQLLAQLAPQQQQQLQALAAYPAESAGAMMSSDFVTLAPDMQIVDAIAALRQSAADRETLYLLYVVDDQQKLLGVISLRQLIQAAPEQWVSEIMSQDLITGGVDEDQEKIALSLAHYRFLALPIVDAAQRLVGIVTYDDAMQVLNAESYEDFLKSSAVQTDGAPSLKSTSIWVLYKNRVFWLVILVFGSLLSGIGIAYFEEIIAQNLVLVFFLPLLVGSGGNAGSQSATLMVRALATGDVELKDWFGLLGRESLVALALGTTMALAVSILGYLRGDFWVAVVLALSMLGIVLLGCLIGMSLPFILNKLKLDPASASAPLVTSICDATGVVVYLFIASLLLF